MTGVRCALSAHVHSERFYVEDSLPMPGTPPAGIRVLQCASPEGEREVRAVVPAAVVSTRCSTRVNGSSFLELKPKLCDWLKLLVSLVLTVFVKQDTSLPLTSRLQSKGRRGFSPSPTGLVRTLRCPVFYFYRPESRALHRGSFWGMASFWGMLFFELRKSGSIVIMMRACVELTLAGCQFL